MSDLAQFDRALRAVWLDPKFKAQAEWFRDYGVGSQLAVQVPRGEREHYAETGQHYNPNRRIAITLHEMPDFDWWEPRYDQPGRREQTRRREFGLLTSDVGTTL